MAPYWNAGFMLGISSRVEAEWPIKYGDEGYWVFSDGWDKAYYQLLDMGLLSEDEDDE